MEPTWSEEQARTATELWIEASGLQAVARDPSDGSMLLAPPEPDDARSPLSQWRRYRSIVDMEPVFRSGQRDLLFSASVECLRRGWPLPDWVRSALLEGFDRFDSMRAKSLDEAFDVKRGHTPANRRRRVLAEHFAVLVQAGFRKRELPPDLLAALARRASAGTDLVRTRWREYRNRLAEDDRAATARAIAAAFACDKSSEDF